MSRMLLVALCACVGLGCAAETAGDTGGVAAEDKDDVDYTARVFYKEKWDSGFAPLDPGCAPEFVGATPTCGETEFTGAYIVDKCANSDVLIEATYTSSCSAPSSTALRNVSCSEYCRSIGKSTGTCQVFSECSDWMWSAACVCAERKATAGVE